MIRVSLPCPNKVAQSNKDNFSIVYHPNANFLKQICHFIRVLKPTATRNGVNSPTTY